jgi:hypothetical protein
MPRPAEWTNRRGYTSDLRTRQVALHSVGATSTNQIGSGTGLVSIALRQYLAGSSTRNSVEITATDLGE